MFTSSDKKSTHSTVVQQKAAGNTFFRKAGEEGFFGEKANASFFSAPVQTKLNVSSPDDPQEKEADAVADRVMRMEDHAPVASDQKKEELHRSEGDHSNASGNKSANEIQSGEQGDEEIDLKEEKEKVQTKPATIFRMVQAKVENEKEENIQTKIYRKIYRSQQAYKTPVESNNSAENFNTTAAASSLYHSDVIQRSGRGPPGNSIPFEQSLTSSKGGGSALPGDTQQFMESRFNADFSGVKIHTGSAAENLSTSINAQAFTHGNDIYFNSGKYSPNTTGGSTLLAHELTHTIQQGASKSNTSSTQVSPSIARKNIIQRSSGGGVPSQLTNAVAKAKSKEGKVNANKEGPDGFREGWKDLVDFYKTTFGADKVVSGGAGAGVKDAVSETDIKKKRMTTGLVPDPERPGKAYQGERDAMPSWCGIFVFWALNKSGVPMPKWKIGGKMVDLKAAYPGGYTPKPGDIAYRAAYSHYAIVESVNGNLVRSVNGNTSGEDNMGGQIQSREHPLSNWTGFFNPLLLMEGNLGSGEGAAEEKPKTLKELRKEKFNINKKEAEPDIEAAKEDGESVNENGQNENHIQTKTELSSWSVGGDGKLNTNSSPSAPADKNKLQAKEEEKKEEDKHLASNEFGLQKKQMTSL
ncbi:MAG: DUF4157 domain-containing protein, partial [Ginsengibacter sp.]